MFVLERKRAQRKTRPEGGIRDLLTRRGSFRNRSCSISFRVQSPSTAGGCQATHRPAPVQQRRAVGGTRGVEVGGVDEEGAVGGQALDGDAVRLGGGQVVPDLLAAHPPPDGPAVGGPPQAGQQVCPPSTA